MKYYVAQDTDEVADELWATYDSARQKQPKGRRNRTRKSDFPGQVTV